MYGIVLLATCWCLIECDLNVQLSANVPSADVQLSCNWEGDTKLVTFLENNQISDKFQTAFDKSRWRCAIVPEGTTIHKNDVTMRAKAKSEYGLTDSNEKTTYPAIVVTLACGNIILGASILVLLPKTRLTVCLRRAFGKVLTSANSKAASVIMDNAASAIEDIVASANEDNVASAIEENTMM